VRTEAPYWGTLLPQLPRLIERFLTNDGASRLQHEIERLTATTRRQNAWLAATAISLAAIAGALVYRLFQ
jgi:ubiquinone biosynthesis protein